MPNDPISNDPASNDPVSASGDASASGAEISQPPNPETLSLSEQNQAASLRMQNATPTEQAVNILQAAALQRQAISEAYQKQKRAMEEAIISQKAAALHQSAVTRHTEAQVEADGAINSARSATQNLKAALGHPENDQNSEDDGILSVTDRRLIAALAQLENERRAQALTPQALAASGIPQLSPQYQASVTPQNQAQANQNPADQQTGPKGSGNPIIDELLTAIRTIVSQEVTKQLTLTLEKMISDSNAETPDEQNKKDSAKTKT